MANDQNERVAGDQKATRSTVTITESENNEPRADANPGRTPGKAEGVDDPETEGNE